MKLTWFLWFRLAAIVVFCVAMATQQMWLFCAVGAGLGAVTVAQLLYASRK